MSAEYASGESNKTINNGQKYETASVPQPSLSDIVMGLAQTIKKGELAVKYFAGEKNSQLGEELVKAGITAVDEMSRLYPNSMDTVMELLPIPKQLKPYVKGVLNELGKEPWDVTVDSVSIFLKEMGRNRDNGEYLNTREVVQRTFGKVLQKQVLEYLRGESGGGSLLGYLFKNAGGS